MHILVSIAFFSGLAQSVDKATIDDIGVSAFYLYPGKLKFGQISENVHFVLKCFFW